MVEVPIIYIYLYSKIKDGTHGNLIKTPNLKAEIRRIIICSKGKGGNTKGIPDCYMYDIIRDMINLALLKRIDKFKYQILTCNQKRLRQFW